MVPIGCAILGHAIGFIQMINHELIDIIGTASVLATNGGLIAVIHPKKLGVGSCRDPRDFDPDKSNLVQGVKSFDVELEGHLVIRAHKPDVGAIGSCIAKIEISRVEPKQERDILQVSLDVGPGRRGIQPDLLAILPVLMPPGIGGCCPSHKHYAGQQDRITRLFHFAHPKLRVS